MRRFICAAVLAVALSGLGSGLAVSPAGASEGSATVASIDVVRIRTALNLSSDQQRHWPAVEAALRGIARDQAAAGEGAFARLKRKVVAITVDSSALMRLAQAAAPLIDTLSDGQRQTARNLAREMGLGQIVAAL